MSAQVEARDQSFPNVDQELRLDPYEINKGIAFLLDYFIEITPLSKTNFRIGPEIISQLRELLGAEVVDPFEQTIVKNRIRSLRGVATKLAGQGALTFALSTNILPPGELITSASILGGAGGAIGGEEWETRDRNRAFSEVYNVTLPMIQKLLIDYLPEFHEWTEDERRTFVYNITESIALGESMARPEIAATIFGLVNGLALFTGGRSDLAKLILGAAGIVAGIQHSELREGRVLQEFFDKESNRTTDLMYTDDTFKTDFASTLFQLRAKGNIAQQASEEMVKRWTAGSLLRWLTRFAVRFGIVAGAYVQQSEGLAFSLFSQLTAHLDQVNPDRRKDFSKAQVGINDLRIAIETIHRNNASLRSDLKLQAHCDEFHTHHPDAYEIDPDLVHEDSVCIFSPFTVQFQDKEKPTLIMENPLELRVGLYLLSSQARVGESTFLRSLNHDIRIDEKTESYVKVHENNQDAWRPLHQLSPTEMRNFFSYTTAEPEYSRVNQAVLFAQDIYEVEPRIASGDSVAHDILQRYHNGESLTTAEQNAILLGLQLLAGRRSEDEIYAMNMNREQKIIVHQLLPYFRPYRAKAELVEKLKKYKVKMGKKERALFNKNDFYEIMKANTHGQLPPPVRAKLRILKSLERAKRLHTKVVEFDQVMDPIDDDYTKRFIAYFAEWCKEQKAAVLISTRQEQNKGFIRNAPHQLYQQTLGFSAPYVHAEREAQDSKSL